MPDIKNWLVKQLDGFTSHELQTLEVALDAHKKELDEVKTARVVERTELQFEIDALKNELFVLRVATNSEKLEVLKEPLSTAPVPWRKLKRDFEMRDAMRAHENTKTEKRG